MKKNNLLFLAFTFIFITQANSQSKLVIDDKPGILTSKSDSLFISKFQQNGIEYTSLVDFKNKCDYYFATLYDFEGSVWLKLQDCNEVVLGNKNIGIRFKNAPDDEKAVIITYAILDAIENPQQTEERVVAEKTPAEPIIKSATATDENETLFETMENEHNTRHFFSPSSYNLRQGELYYNTIYFLIHDLQYGINDKFSIGMGTTVGGFPFYLTPKLTFPVNEKNTFAVGDLFILGTYSVDFTANLAYATYTRGNKIKNITTGLGYLSTSDGDITGNTNSFVLNLSGMTKISDYIYFISENYFFTIKNKNTASYYFYNDITGEDTFYEKDFTRTNFHILGISGFRFVSKKRDVDSFQAGLTYLFVNREDIPTQYSGANWNISGNDEATSTFIFPTVSYTHKFGKKY